MKWEIIRPTERDDGTPLQLSEIDHYIATVGLYEYELPKTAQEVDVDLPDGTWCCSIVTVDTDGQPSVSSNSVCQTQATDQAPPNPPVVEGSDDSWPIVSPPDGAKNVALDSQVTATWSEGVDADDVIITVKDSNGDEVPGDMS